MSVYIGQIILSGFTFAPQGFAFCDGQLVPIAQNETLFQLIGTTYGGDGVTTFAMPDLRGRVPIGTGQGPGLTNYVIGEAAGTESLTLSVPQIPAHTHAINADALTASVRVRNGVGNQLSPAGNVFAVDSAPPFTNPKLTPGSDIIRAVDITELRARIDAYRLTFNLVPFSYTDPALTTGSTVVKAVHILELRTALHQAYIQAGLTPPVYSDPPPAVGTTARAAHINEIRDAVSAVTNAPVSYNSGPPNSNMNASAVSLAGSNAPGTGGSLPHENRQPYLALNYCVALEGIFPPLP